MQVHQSMDSLPEIASPVVTVGSFDGVHVGHRVIIGRLNDLASQVDGSSVLITFHPHPRMVLYPESSGKDLKLINSQEEKIKLLQAEGVSVVPGDAFGPSAAGCVRIGLAQPRHTLGKACQRILTFCKSL